jgi:hypothetical protein
MCITANIYKLTREDVRDLLGFIKQLSPNLAIN